jgi:hypothetical protein
MNLNGQTAFGQASDLKASSVKLQELVGPVQSGSKRYEQTITFQEPAVIRYGYVETDQKGNAVNMVYEFNLSDLDPYAVREQTQKDMISVVCAVRNKQKLIKVYKNEVVQAYEDQAMILGKDIENARAISDVIKKAIPAAEKVMASRLKLNGYDAMITWLIANVKNVSLGAKAINQTLTKGEEAGTLKLVRVETDAKASSEHTFEFNVADVNPNAIVYKINGNQIAISMDIMQDAKYVQVRKNGEVKPYENSVLLNTNNADEARDLKNVLTSVIPLALEKVKASMPSVSSEKDGLQRIKPYLTDITIGSRQISQSIDGDCHTTITQIEKDPKTSEKNVYTFHWMDVNPLTTKIGVAGERMFIEISFNEGRKAMMHTANDKFKGYDNTFKLFMPDVEGARSTKFIIEKMIEKCKSSYKEPFGNDVGSTTAYIREHVKDVSMDEVTVKQSLEPVEGGNNNKYKYTVIEVNPKGTSTEQVYEFNLSDMNPQTVNTDVRGRWLYVSVETDFKGKIIKYYKDGKIQPYTSVVQFAINDVDVSRSLMSAFKKAVAALKPK